MVDVPSTTFSVASIIEKLAEQEGISLGCDGIDDVCYGMTIGADTSLVQFLNNHRVPYNFQVIDGDPIRVVRRAINSDFVIDLDIAESECIYSNPNTPAITFSRIDPATLAYDVEVQYTDPERFYATTTQTARHIGVQRHGSSFVSAKRGGRPNGTKVTYPLNFIISADQARTMAFDILYRMWSQTLLAKFEHRNLEIEPGDVIQLTTAEGAVSTVLVQQNTFTKNRTNQIDATALLVSSGITIAAGHADDFPTGPTASGSVSGDTVSGAHLITGG